jgi:hypothetical protein
MATVPVQPGNEIFVEFYAMQAVTYSCNGGPVQEAVWNGGMHHIGTCQFTASGGETVQLWPVP